jgi:lipopolysaccharide transport system ATP-binding protein
MTDGQVCVSVRGVSKKFSRSLKRSFVYGARDIGRTVLGLGSEPRLRPSEFWAVRDVSFDLKEGDTLGIIGLNGSGKTTLLRMISGILRPTLGEIHVRGRIAPMLALGAGFKPVLSGRENIYLNLSLLGVAEREIHKRFDAIVDFAELHESIDAPLGTYSSGMRGRLGFACAVHTDPGILVVDEVLSVGDTRFRVKCRNKINELRREGTAMLLVSHSALLIESLTTQCLYLKKGFPAAYGPPPQVLKMYERDQITRAIQHNTHHSDSPELPLSERGTTMRIRSAEILVNNDEQGFWLSGRPGRIVITMDCIEEISHVTVNIMIVDQTHHVGETVLILRSGKDDGLLTLRPGQPTVTLTLPSVGLRGGLYRLKINVSKTHERKMLDVVDNLRLIVKETDATLNCLYYQPRHWQYEAVELTAARDDSLQFDTPGSEDDIQDTEA